jgi:hypothetical protein
LDDKLFLFGGQNEAEGKVHASGHCLDLQSSQWSDFTALPQSRHSATCTLWQRLAFVCGGANEGGVVEALLVVDTGN